MSMMDVVWLALSVIFLVVEIATVGLTSIWMAGGALVALAVSFAGLNLGIQVAVFIAVTGVLLYFTRPWAAKYLNAKSVKTNYEEVIGKTIQIAQRVDNRNQTGMAVVDGKEWTVRAECAEEILEAGEDAEVLRVEGVKLIVRKKM